MKALDTNVLARFFVDDPDDAEAARQRPAAVAALSERSSVTITVVLEFEWVLRGFYVLSRSDVVRVLRALVGIEHVVVEDRALVAAAIDAMQQGADFADALHLLRSTKATSFLTFDRRLARRAARIEGALPVQLLGR